MYIPKYFKLYELLPKQFYESNKYKGDILWYLFDNRLLITLDELRYHFGTMTINNWYWGGDREYSGFRPPNCIIGENLSQHRFGRASDIIFKNYTANYVRNFIVKNKGYSDFRYITGMEKRVPWLHIDVRNYNGLFLFNG